MWSVEPPPKKGVQRAGWFAKLGGLMLAGAIFDWDGVVVDSSAAHKLGWERLAEEEGLPLPENHFLRGFGRKNEWIIPHLYQWTSDPAEIARLGRRKEELYRDSLAKMPLEPLPGVVALLEGLRAAAIPCAVGSSTPRANIEYVIDRLQLRTFFRAIVCAEDVTKGKPDPEVFLKAAARLGVEPVQCVVFEDAPFGLEAARAGAMKAVGVETSHPASNLPAAHVVVHRLTEVSVPWLQRLWA